MDLKWFRVPRDIVFGQGTLEYLSKLDGTKAMLVTGGRSMRRLGFLDRATEYLESAGMAVEIVDGVEPNPSVQTVKRGAAAMRTFEPDLIVAIGGGSALDAAKIMWAFYEHPDLTFEEIIPVDSIPKLRTKARFVAIPSTSGTASEITAFSVITDTERHIKYPIVSYEITPDVAILDPEVAAAMPPAVTANTGMDVLTHAVEAFVSTSASSYTDPLALEAIKLVFENLRGAYENGSDMTARENMHNASTLAGMAFTNSSLGCVHSMAHKIGGRFNITHGLANAILLPYVIEYNRDATPKYAEIEAALGIDDLAVAVQELNAQVGIATTLADNGEVEITEAAFRDALQEMSQNACEDPCTFTNPRETGCADLADIYEAAYFGKLQEN
ncbi:MAG: iron-containing alcohol dehydrogenase [Spirochaetaceae bacterium]